MSNILAAHSAKVKSLVDEIESNRKFINQVATTGFDLRRLKGLVLATATRTPELLQCTPNSWIKFMIQCAELNLFPGPMGHIYPVPFKNNKVNPAVKEVQTIIGYKGYTDLMMRHPSVLSVNGACVYEQDEFEYELGTSPFIRHKKGDHDYASKDVTHAYCIVSLKGGGHVITIHTRKEIEHYRSKSAQRDGNIWRDNYAPMAVKTTVRQVVKFCPTTPELVRAEALEMEAETGIDVVLWDPSSAEDVVEAVEALPNKERGVSALKAKVGAGNSEEVYVPSSNEAIGREHEDRAVYPDDQLPLEDKD